MIEITKRIKGILLCAVAKWVIGMPAMLPVEYSIGYNLGFAPSAPRNMRSSLKKTA
jgi:hypothetical protein